MREIACTIFLAGVIAIVCRENCCAVAVWFGDSEFNSLSELDLALESGEISETEYDILVESFLSGEIPDSTHHIDNRIEEAIPIAPVPGERSPYGIKYRGSLIQDLEPEYGFRRYDRLSLKRNGWQSELSLEQHNGVDAQIRSRSVSYHHNTGRVTLGSYSVKLGDGITVGNAPFTTKLRHYGTLEESLAHPIKNRENGILFEQGLNKLHLIGFASLLEGEEFYRRSTGGEFRVGGKDSHGGLIVLHQEIGSYGSVSHWSNYLAPAFKTEFEEFNVSGESSFRIAGGNAHVYSVAGELTRIKPQVIFFSYSTGYRNPQSGGFAYSDYEQTELTDVGFSFSDKRSGRIGIAVSSKYSPLKNVTVQSELVRWQNRIAARQCVAVRGMLRVGSISDVIADISIRGVWEDFNLKGNDLKGNDPAGNGDDQRKFVSATARLKLGLRHDLKCFAKIEERHSSSGRKFPMRFQCDWKGMLSSAYSAGAGVYYYDPDNGSGGDDYVALYAEQTSKRDKLVGITIRGRSRYRFGEKTWRDWEVRVTADVAY